MLTTLDMMNEALKTGRTYISSSMRYSVEEGFHDDRNKAWSSKAFDTINEIMNLYWKPLEVSADVKKMTLKQIEEKLGYRIELVSR